MSSKRYDTMGNDVSAAYNSPDATRPGNSTEIMGAAHDILSAAHDMNSIISVLEAVNMDRLAKRLMFIQATIANNATRIPGWVSDWQRRELGHNGNILGGLLGVALKMGDMQGKLDKAEAGDGEQH